MIELKDFSCMYGSKKIVKNCSFSLKNGELTALLGANGCGKSTLIKGICRCVKTEGSCLIDGVGVSGDPRTLAKQVAYIPQRCGINIPISLLDTVLMGGGASMPLFASYSREQRQEALEVLRKFTDSDPCADFLTLSEGQKQLVILARAFYQGSGNLLLDEPESALDFSNKHIIMEKIAGLARSGKCILISLHDPSLALRYCDRLLFMKDGRIIGDAVPGLTDETRLQELFRSLYPEARLLRSGRRLILDTE